MIDTCDKQYSLDPVDVHQTAHYYNVQAMSNLISKYTDIQIYGHFIMVNHIFLSQTLMDDNNINFKFRTNFPRLDFGGTSTFTSGWDFNFSHDNPSIS